MTALPTELEGYLAELTRRLEALLGPALAAVWCGGSAALGAYQHGRSDVDVVAMTSTSLNAEQKEAVVDALRHDALPCPARKLEYVQYARDDLREHPVDPAFDLEINDGPTGPLTVAYGADDRPADEGSFWYVLDRAQLHQSALVLFGPPAEKLLPPVAQSVLMDAVTTSIRWHLTAGVALGDDAALNACRSLYWARTGTWTDKQTAGRWLLTDAVAASLPETNRRTIADALAARTSGEGSAPEDVAPEDVTNLLEWCLARLGPDGSVSDRRDA
jgi:hypothetical protein